jgi:hypothetical protein
MNRSLESRVGRLERGSGVGDPDQIYVVWCRPDEDEDQTMQAAIDRGLVVVTDKGVWPGGMALSCRWHGSGPMPEPRWLTFKDATDDELDALIDSIRARLLRDGSLTPQEDEEMERDPNAYLTSQRAGGKCTAGGSLERKGCLDKASLAIGLNWKM